MRAINYRLKEKLYRFCRNEAVKRFLVFAVLLEIKHLVFKEDCISFISAIVVSVMFTVIYYICRLIKRIIFKYNAVRFSEISLYYIREGDR